MQVNIVGRRFRQVKLSVARTKPYEEVGKAILKGDTSLTRSGAGVASEKALALLALNACRMATTRLQELKRCVR